ncbi:MAG: hypothetical protein LC798_21245, partial [Chloroflexi bacterium]|nr:hypothetical protein [Chloroflexota bacterium]
MLQRITLTIAGERQLDRGFDVLADDARDLREPLERTHEHLRDVIGEQFLTEGGHAGSRWAQLSPAYAAAKAERYGDGMPILVATGDMRAAFLARRPLELTSRRLVMGPAPGQTNVEGEVIEDYALRHQQGGGRTPQRKIVNLTTGDKRSVDRIFAEYFSARARRMIGT